jgi:hypothetical protein
MINSDTSAASFCSAREGAAGRAQQGVLGLEAQKSADQMADFVEVAGSALRRLKKRSSRSPKIFFPITVITDL